MAKPIYTLPKLIVEHLILGHEKFIVGTAPIRRSDKAVCLSAFIGLASQAIWGEGKLKSQVFRTSKDGRPCVDLV